METEPKKHFIMIQEFYIFLCIDLRMEKFYPGTKYGDLNQVGEGPGKGSP